MLRITFACLLIILYFSGAKPDSTADFMAACRDISKRDLESLHELIGLIYNEQSRPGAALSADQVAEAADASSHQIGSAAHKYISQMLSSHHRREPVEIFDVSFMNPCFTIMDHLDSWDSWDNWNLDIEPTDLEGQYCATTRAICDTIIQERAIIKNTLLSHFDD